MEQIKRNFPYVLFISLGLKLIIFSSSNYIDAAALLVLGLGLAFFELRVENKKFQELTNKINDLEKKDQYKTELLEELRKNVNSVKIVNGMKQQVSRNGQ